MKIQIELEILKSELWHEFQDTAESYSVFEISFKTAIKKVLQKQAEIQINYVDGYLSR